MNVISDILSCQVVSLPLEATRTRNRCDGESLEGLYLELRDADRVGDVQAFIRKDLALHETIWKIADNEHFETALQGVVRPWFAFTAARLASTEAFQLVQDAGRHLSFVDRIKSHDPQAAREAFLAALDEWCEFSKRSETGLVSAPPQVGGAW